MKLNVRIQIGQFIMSSVTWLSITGLSDIQPAQSGDLRVANDFVANFRANDDLSDIKFMSVDAANRITFGNSAQDYFRLTPAGGDASWYCSGEFIGTVAPAQNWYFRVGGINTLIVGPAVTTYDSATGITTDHCVLAQYLIANKTTTLVTGDATNFVLPAIAGEVWEIEISGNLACSGAGGAALGLDAPGGTTISGQFQYTTTAINASAAVAVTAVNTAFGGASGTSAARPFSFRATVFMGGSSGNLVPRLYSVTAGQTSTLSLGAKMVARRLNVGV